MTRNATIPIALALAILASAGQAQPRLGIFFDDQEFTPQTTNFDPAPSTPFQAHVVMIDAGFSFLGGYECGIAENSGGLVLVTGVAWPNNGLNFGDELNHLVGFGTPVPVNVGGTVVATMIMMHVTGEDPVEFTMGQATPPSIPGHEGPVVADGLDPDILIPGRTITGAVNGPVATLHDDGIWFPWPVEFDLQITLDGQESVRAAAMDGATDGYDQGLDQPADGDARIRFPRPGWNVPGIADFDQDVRSPYDTEASSKTWTITVETEVADPQNPRLVHLESTSPTLPPDADINLYDRTAGVTIPLPVGGAYEYVAYATEVRTLDLFVGQMNFPEVIDVGVDAYLGNRSDTGNRARTAAGASDGWDGAHDVPEPSPPPSDYLHLSFHHADWPLGPYFRIDSRAPYDAQQEWRAWPLQVETDQAGTVRLAFSPNFTANAGVGLVLFDPDTMESTNLLPGLEYTFETTGGVHEFELRIGAPIHPDLDPTGRVLETGWSLVGLPLAPAAGATLSDVILAAAPGYAYGYGLDQAGSYEYLPPATAASRERGYWIGTDQAYEWSMDGSFDFSTLLLPARNGWNLLGNPIWFPASVAGIQVHHQGTVHSWNDAVAAGLVSGVVYGYNPSAATYEEATSLQAWHGYWVRVLVDDAALVMDWLNFQTADPLPRVLGQPDLPATLRWTVDLSLESAGGIRRTVTCGVDPEATAGFDARADKPRPPASPAGETLGISVLRADLPPTLDRRYRQELSSPEHPEHRWDLELRATHAGTYTLSWQRGNWPADLDLQLYRPDRNRVLVTSLREADMLTVELGDDPLILTLRTPAATTAPDADVMLDRLTAAPNPFNPTTSLKLQISQPGDVAVAIYDVRGQHLRDVELGPLPAGRHEVTWQARDGRGRDLASGIYFAVLERDGRRVGQVTKLNLVR